METKNDGTITAINTYDDYGVFGPVSGTENVGRFRYTGQTWIPEVGLYYYKARMLSPTLGRFMQRDPIGYADGMNMYAYVSNDPVNFIDPTGLKMVCVFPKPKGAQDSKRECEARRGKWVDSNAIVVTANTGDNEITVYGHRIRIGGLGPGTYSIGQGGVAVGKFKIVPEEPVIDPDLVLTICKAAFAPDGQAAGTLELGVAGSTQLGPIGGVFNGGVVFDSAGNVGLIGEAGPAVGAGFGGLFGGRMGFSNASSIEELAGPAIVSSTTLAFASGGAVDIGYAPGSDVITGGFTAGLGGQFSASSAVTQTVVIPLFDVSDLFGC
nr:RHS repeat-associated core domain-containing protein [Pontixanthobacter sp. CEM42]